MTAVAVSVAALVMYWIVLVDGGYLSSGGSTDQQPCLTCRTLRLEVAAIHEAGHAVVAVAVGLGVQRIELYPDGRADEPDVGGTTYLECADADLTEYLAMVWAGPTAETHDPTCHQRVIEHYRAAHHLDVTIGLDRGDAELVDDTIREAGATAQHAEFSAASRQFAERLVTDNWDVVRQVASQMLESDDYRLGGVVVHAMVEREHGRTAA